MEIHKDTYIQIATRCYGEHIARPLYEYWQVINDEFYQGKLPAPLITFEVMKYGGCIACCYAHAGHIKVLDSAEGIKIDPKTIAILLHEVIHYARPYVEQTEQKAKTYYTSHNCPYWISEINRIYKQITGEELGADLTRCTTRNGKRIRLQQGKLSQDDLGAFPHIIPGADVVYKYLTAILNKRTQGEPAETTCNYV